MVTVLHTRYLKNVIGVNHVPEYEVSYRKAAQQAA